MIASDCNKCCHFKDNKCLANQFFINTSKCAYAVGFCRYWRSQKWAKNKNATQEKLIQLAIQESKLEFDLVIIHSDDDNLQSLGRSLTYSSYPVSPIDSYNIPILCKRIIIADVTRKTNRSQIIDIFKNHKGLKNLDVLVPSHEEEKPEQTVKRISKTIKEKYFVVVPSNKILSGKDIITMTEEVNDKDTRFVFWPFMNRIAKTIVLPFPQVYGLYITDAYKTLTRPTEAFRTFTENLREEELSGICLSCPVNVIIDNG